MFDGAWNVRIPADTQTPLELSATLQRRSGDLRWLASGGATGSAGAQRSANGPIVAGVKDGRISLTVRDRQVNAQLRWDTERLGQAKVDFQTRLNPNRANSNSDVDLIDRWWPANTPIEGSAQAQVAPGGRVVHVCTTRLAHAMARSVPTPPSAARAPSPSGAATCRLTNWPCARWSTGLPSPTASCAPPSWASASRSTASACKARAGPSRAAHSKPPARPNGGPCRAASRGNPSLNSKPKPSACGCPTGWTAGSPCRAT